MKKLLRPFALLIVVTITLFVLSMAFSTVGAKRAKAEEDFVFSYLLMDSTSFEDEPYEGEDESVKRVVKGSDGYIVEVKVDGYVEPISIWVGVKNDGYVTGITIREMDETLGLGRRALSEVDFLLQYLRSEGDLTVGENIDALTGATVTSKAITKAVNSAVAVVTGADVTSSATKWGE